MARRGRSSVVLAIVGAGLLLAAGSGHAVEPDPLVAFSALPVTGQLYPRDTSELRDGPGAAQVLVAGRVEKPGYAGVVLEILRDGTRWRLLQRGLATSATESTFRFMPRIEAGLFEYRFLVHLERDGVWTTVADREHVVVGDVFLIQGQSNAVASDYHFEQRANAELQRPWIRSFGTASLVPGVVEADLIWYLADGEGFNDKGTVGSWGLRMAQLLSQTFQMPIALLNGAVGGTAINYHLRDDADPDNLDTNYGRLLYRATQGGVRQQARAMIWYQGESDGDNIVPWAQDFGELSSDWLEDYPGIEQIYVFQIRNSCGAPTLEMQNLQRRLTDFYPLVTTLSTTAASGHDFCHFFYEGYYELGARLARIMARDLWGGPDIANLDAPDVDHAYFSSPLRDEVTVVFRDADDTLILEPGAEEDFSLSDGRWVVAAQVVGSEVILSLDGSSDATWIAYEGHAYDGPWLRNSRGVGALVFRFPVRR